MSIFIPRYYLSSSIRIDYHRREHQGVRASRRTITSSRQPLGEHRASTHAKHHRCCCVPFMATPTIAAARHSPTTAAAAALVEDDPPRERKERQNVRQVDWNPLKNVISFAYAFQHHWRADTINWRGCFNIILVHTAAAVGVAATRSCQWQTLLFACILAILGWVRWAMMPRFGCGRVGGAIFLHLLLCAWRCLGPIDSACMSDWATELLRNSYILTRRSEVSVDWVFATQDIYLQINRQLVCVSFTHSSCTACKTVEDRRGNLSQLTLRLTQSLCILNSTRYVTQTGYYMRRAW